MATSSEVLEKHEKQEIGSPTVSQLLLHIHYPEISKELCLGRKAGFLCSNNKNNNSYHYSPLSECQVLY